MTVPFLKVSRSFVIKWDTDRSPASLGAIGELGSRRPTQWRKFLFRLILAFPLHFLVLLVASARALPSLSESVFFSPDLYPF